MTRRLLALAAAAGATAALVATPASADATCVTTDEAPFESSYVCVALNSVISHYIAVPYSVGSICVAGVCTEPIVGTLNVPVANANVVQAYGEVCVRPTKYSPLVCRAFDSAKLIGPIQIG